MSDYEVKIINDYMCVVEHGDQSDYGYCIPLKNVMGEGTLLKNSSPEDVYNLQFLKI